MAFKILVPRLGWTMEEGTLVEWLKKEGEAVQAGELLFVLEADKSAQDIEAIESGVLRLPPAGPQPGDKVKVGDVLGYLLEAGEPVPWEQAGAAAKSSTAQAAKAGARSAEPAAAARKLPDAAASRKPESAGVRNRASPRARRVARELSLDWQNLHGSGRNGRIRERDVRAAATQTSQQPSRIPITPFRKTIADRMLAGANQTAPVTLTTRADATELVSLRDRLKAGAGAEGVVPGYTDLIVKIAATALKEHPRLNASWTDAGILTHASVHIGVAVDTDAGLLAPVLRDVDSLGVNEIATRSRTLVEQARARKLAAEQMQGGTFTITNLGMFGIDAFTPIINLPQCAILGLGRIVREPAVHNDQVVPRWMMALSLTFDHRVVDGAPAARFLDTIRKAIEQPPLWLQG